MHARPAVDASPGSSEADALLYLKRLGPALLEATTSDLAGMLPGLSSAVERIVAEHQGMADELVCVYEQLGIVFEVTRKLAAVEDEPQILELLVKSLSRSFQHRAIHVSVPSRTGEWSVASGELAVNPWLNGVIDQSRRRRGVVVEPVGAGTLPGDVAEIMVSPVFSGDTLAAVLILFRATDAPPFKASEMLLVESLTTFCGDLIRSHRLVRELREMSVSMVRSLVSAVDQKDEYTCGHSLRVAHYATALGREIGLGAVDLQMLQWSALLHDVGKIGIRDSVLKKPGRLTAEEFEHIKEHPVRSHKVVQQVPQLGRALDGVLHHHERYDGSGYPAGLRGEEIPLQARVIQIADVFDALTSNRSYRDAYDWSRALEIMAEEAGRTGDPHLQKVFDAWVRRTVGPEESGWRELTARAGRIDVELEPNESAMRGT